MALEAPPEEAAVLSEPVYGVYEFARSLLKPGMSVLDVGCGNGKVAAYLASSGAQTDGIEPSARRALVAATRVRYVSTVEAGQPDSGLLSSYQAITFFDVLEHLADPQSTLNWAASMTDSGGLVIASIPNSAHYSFRLKILRGDWSMADSGLFDSTHLRFYDIRSATTLRPEGMILHHRRFYSPGAEAGLRRRLVQRRPNLFALHTVLVWHKPASRADG